MKAGRLLGGEQMKRTFEIEWDNNDPYWMNTWNLMTCLTRTCQHTRFTVRDVTGDLADPAPYSGGPLFVDGPTEEPTP